MTISAEDRMQMIEQMARYNQRLDAGDRKAWVEVFTEDGVLVRADGTEIQGRTALEAEFGAMSGSPLERHWVNNWVVEENGEGVSVFADMGVLKGNSILETGRYINRMKSVDGNWKIARQEHFNDSD